MSIVTLALSVGVLLLAGCEAMARAGGPGGCGDGGYGGARGGGIRSAPPGNYRMRRVYKNWDRPASPGNTNPNSQAESRMRPGSGTNLTPDQLSSHFHRNPTASAAEGRPPYRDITEKYERLREARHKGYWNQLPTPALTLGTRPGMFPLQQPAAAHGISRSGTGSRHRHGKGADQGPLICCGRAPAECRQGVF